MTLQTLWWEIGHEIKRMHSTPHVSLQPWRVTCTNVVDWHSQRFGRVSRMQTTSCKTVVTHSWTAVCSIADWLMRTHASSARTPDHNPRNGFCAPLAKPQSRRTHGSVRRLFWRRVGCQWRWGRRPATAAAAATTTTDATRWKYRVVNDTQSAADTCRLQCKCASSLHALASPSYRVGILGSVLVMY